MYVYVCMYVFLKYTCRPKICAAVNWSARGSVFCTEKTRVFLRTLL